MRGPEGFPPAPWYQLLPDNKSATGRQLGVVAYRRQIEEDLARVLCSAPGWVDTHTAHCAWLIEHGGKYTRSLCETPRAQTLRWTGVPSLRRAVQAHQTAIERDFAATVRELLQARLLLAEVAKAARPTIEVALHDERGDCRIGLPDPATLLQPRLQSRAKSTRR